MSQDIEEEKQKEREEYKENIQLESDEKEGKSFFKICINNPFTKTFTYLFFLFFAIICILGLIYGINTDLFGLTILILFPFFSGFFFLYLIYPLIFQNKENNISFKKEYNLSIIISALVLCIPIWVLGILNMFIGLFLFVYILVVGNLSSLFEQKNRLLEKIPANKLLNLFLLLIAFVIPMVFFGIKLVSEVGVENILNLEAVLGYLLSHGIILLFGDVAVMIVCPISIGIVLLSNKEVGKRVVVFCFLFIWLIMTWIYEVIGDFSLTQIAIAQLPILLFTLYNILSQVKGEIENFDTSVKKAQSSSVYRIFRKKSNNHLLNALVFLIFCSLFFGYLTAKTSLSIITIRLNKWLNMWSISIPDIGTLVPNIIQIIIALIIVVPFLIISAYSLNKKN
ncbi:MAG: hypothetical protein GF317_10740 [Candidatus Lokiarchaeota archaeon]|nr:hypothetical protein [Candidatus Lokiarchaeota archaeon]MBD3200138.1 hypothetical protein [Candidatus Lokiarchaeota archaeon]